MKAKSRRQSIIRRHFRKKFISIYRIHPLYGKLCYLRKALHCYYLPLDHPWVAIGKDPFFGPWPKPPWRRRHSVLILWFSKSQDDKIENIRGMLRIVQGFNSLHNVEERERTKGTYDAIDNDCALMCPTKTKAKRSEIVYLIRRQFREEFISEYNIHRLYDHHWKFCLRCYVPFLIPSFRSAFCCSR